jgi:hypothetical protein
MRRGSELYRYVTSCTKFRGSDLRSTRLCKPVRQVRDGSARRRVSYWGDDIDGHLGPDGVRTCMTVVDQLVSLDPVVDLPLGDYKLADGAPVNCRDTCEGDRITPIGPVMLYFGWAENEIDAVLQRPSDAG